MTDSRSTRETLFDSGRSKVTREQLSGGVSEGVEVVYVDNGRLEIAILPTRGMAIWKVRDRQIAGELGWNAPVKRPVHPAFVNQEARNGLGWLEGFNELLCRCGLSSNGPPGKDDGARSPIESSLTLHGRIANIPADNVAPVVGSADSIGLEGTVTEAALFGPQLKLHTHIHSGFQSNEIIVEDRIENRASTATEVQLLYHINIGPPFLEAGARCTYLQRPSFPVMLAAEGIEQWATYLGPTPGYTEEGFFFEPKGNSNGDSVALLANAAGTIGVAVRFQVKNLPWFVQWKCSQPEADGYVTGLEPSTNLANFKAYERKQGRVVQLAAGQTYTTRVTLTTLASSSEVAAVVKEIEAVQGAEPPVVHRTPQAGWSPAGESK